MAKRKMPLPEEFASIEEAQEFWDSHSTADYQEEMEDVDMQLSPKLRAKFESGRLYRLLGLSAQQVAVLEQEAERRSTNARQIITRWVHEHLRNAALSSGA